MICFKMILIHVHIKYPKLYDGRVCKRLFYKDPVVMMAYTRQQYILRGCYCYRLLTNIPSIPKIPVARDILVFSPSKQ